MEAIRKVIDEAMPQIIIDLPEKDYKRRIEVIVLLLEESNQKMESKPSVSSE